MSSFISPYQFIDVTGRVNGGERADLDYDAIKGRRESFVRHDLWHKDGNSGRLICRLTLETPTFVGNEQIKPEDFQAKTAKQVQSLRLDGRIALPATSLRGMIAATAEALSQSALRILDNIDYGVRQDAGEGTNVELGQITPGSEPGNMKIRPFDCCHIRTADAQVFWASGKSRACYADLFPVRGKTRPLWSAAQRRLGPERRQDRSPHHPRPIVDPGIHQRGCALGDSQVRNFRLSRQRRRSPTLGNPSERDRRLRAVVR